MYYRTIANYYVTANGTGTVYDTGNLEGPADYILHMVCIPSGDWGRIQVIKRSADDLTTTVIFDRVYGTGTINYIGLDVLPIAIANNEEIEISLISVGTNFTSARISIAVQKQVIE